MGCCLSLHGRLLELHWLGHCSHAPRNFRMCLPARLRLLVSPQKMTSGSELLLISGTSRSTMWYTREEQALVIGSFYSMNGFQQCVGGLIAYGIAQIQNAALKNWQILFTVCYVSFSLVLGNSDNMQLDSCLVVSLSSGVSSFFTGYLTVPCVPLAGLKKIVCSSRNVSERTRLEFRTGSLRLTKLVSE